MGLCTCEFSPGRVCFCHPETQNYERLSAEHGQPSEARLCNMNRITASVNELRLMRGWISSNWLCLHGNSCCERCILASLILLLTIFICEISSLCEGKSLKATNCRAAYAVMSSKEDYRSDQQTCISFLPSRLQSLFILCHNTTPNDWSTGVQHSGSLCVEEEPNDAQNAPYYVTANRFWSAQPEWTKTAGNQVLVPIISEQRARLCWTEWVRSDRGGAWWWNWVC